MRIQDNDDLIATVSNKHINSYCVNDMHDRLGKVSKKNGFIWDFVPNIGPHPPTAHV